MSGTRNFFVYKKEWSKLKDQILKSYLKPYLYKITATRRPTRIIDCFAGKGMFDDGEYGSPLIIANSISEVLKRNPILDLKAVFIEKNYAKELRHNLESSINCVVIDGEYEDFVNRIISAHSCQNQNYFFYVDPYGIKSLDLKRFTNLKDIRFGSLEILINLNSTGFLREGCRLLSYTQLIPEWADNLEDEIEGKNTISKMDDIAGGNYWQEILYNFQARQIDFHEAEELFIQKYTENLYSYFKYIVHIPIKERSDHMPKYRLVFTTDNPEGLFLMVDAMNKAWHTLLSKENNGQLSFFDEKELPDRDGLNIVDKIWAELESGIELCNLLSLLIKQNGIKYSLADYNAAIKDNPGKFYRVYNPPITPSGRIPNNMDFRKNTIIVSRVS